MVKLKFTNKSIIKKMAFYAPGEWYPHSRTFIVWPSFSSSAKKSYVYVAKKIAKYEEVYLGVPIKDIPLAHKYVKNYPNIKIVNIESNDGWARDTGPLFLVNNANKKAAVVWEYNFTGKTGFNSTNDNLVDERILEILGSKINVKANMTMEGGSISTDGQGILLSTESVIFNKNRNPKMTKEEIIKQILTYYNAKKIILLKKGLENNTDTGGHIDNMARFYAPGKVLLAWNGKSNCKKAMKILEKEGLDITKIPYPKKMVLTHAEYYNMSKNYQKIRKIGQILPGSYVNHYVCNNAVICPSYDKKSAMSAKKILQKCYPDRNIVMIPYKISRDILTGGGNIHCMTINNPI